MTDNTEELIDETEAQLLDAMSVEELPVYKAYAGQELTVGQTKAKMYDIVEAIKTVFDPEIPINVYDLGLIYKINQEDCGNLPRCRNFTATGCRCNCRSSRGRESGGRSRLGTGMDTRKAE